MIQKNAVDVDGNTPLHLASLAGRVEVVEFLVSEANADYQIKNNWGYLAYDVAYNMDVQELFNKLLGITGEENKNQYGRR